MLTNFLQRRFYVPSAPLVPVTLPRSRETHFWYVVPDEVREESLLKHYLEVLSPCEREDIICMQGDNLKKRALLARVLVRTALARYTNFQVNPSLLKFKKNIFGKPEIAWQHDENWDSPPLHFNLSHTSSLIACGVTVDVPIGIDVEEKQRKMKNNISAFSRRYLSPHEVEFLDTFLDPDIQRQEFLKLWTLKEAYVKALGRGFSGAPFKTFTIQLKGDKDRHNPMESISDASEIVLASVADSVNLTTNWKFSLFELVNSYYVAVCVKDDANMEGKESNNSFRLKVWKTLPFVEDKLVSGTNAVVSIGGFS